MTRIELAAAIGEDFAPVAEPAIRDDSANPALRLEEILESIDVLKCSPLIGRLLDGGLRELIIGRGSRGYVALYRFIAESNVVFVLAIRGQREADYFRG